MRSRDSWKPAWLARAFPLEETRAEPLNLDPPDTDAERRSLRAERLVALARSAMPLLADLARRRGAGAFLRMWILGGLPMDEAARSGGIHPAAARRLLRPALEAVWLQCGGCQPPRRLDMHSFANLLREVVPVHAFERLAGTRPLSRGPLIGGKGRKAAGKTPAR